MKKLIEYKENLNFNDDTWMDDRDVYDDYDEFDDVDTDFDDEFDDTEDDLFIEYEDDIFDDDYEYDDEIYERLKKAKGIGKKVGDAKKGLMKQFHIDNAGIISKIFKLFDKAASKAKGASKSQIVGNTNSLKLQRPKPKQ